MDFENFNSKRETAPNSWFDFSDIDFESLLGKYGPEGLYELADKLKKIADDDVSEALNENNMTETYHDYVIKDGKFIGKFDEMYSKFEDPWMQSNQPNRYSRTAGILHLKKFNIKSVLECGCGLGYYADWIKAATGITCKSIDISSVAINKAKELFPALDFEVADISKDLEKYKDCECVMLAEIMWYILPDLKSINEVLLKHFKGKYLMVNQVFYKGTQKYGTEYFTNLQEFIKYMPFKLVGQCEASTEEDTTVETSTIFKIE